MKTLIQSLLVAAVFFALTAFAYSSGPGSCSYPGGPMAGGTRSGTGGFTVTTSSPTYVPGQALSVTVANSNNLLFKGFLVQAVQGSPGITNTNQIGAFSGLGAGMLFANGCSGSNAAVGHSSPTGKQTVSLTWTPPLSATGPITFHLVAVVSIGEWYGQQTDQRDDCARGGGCGNGWWWRCGNGWWWRCGS